MYSQRFTTKTVCTELHCIPNGKKLRRTVLHTSVTLLIQLDRVAKAQASLGSNIAGVGFGCGGGANRNVVIKIFNLRRIQVRRRGKFGSNQLIIYIHPFPHSHVNFCHFPLINPVAPPPKKNYSQVEKYCGGWHLSPLAPPPKVTPMDDGNSL